MITYEEALAIAKERKPNIDGCDEWDGGWVFGYSGDVDYQGGYGHTPVIIIKETGEIVNMMQFIMSGEAGDLRNSFKI